MSELALESLEWMRKSRIQHADAMRWVKSQDSMKGFWIDVAKRNLAVFRRWKKIYRIEMEVV
jgi:hypothetical protein